MHKQPTAESLHCIVPGDGENRFPTLLEVEQEYVQRVLAHVAGNRSRAAQVLGIGRVSLWRKLKRLESPATSATAQLQGYSDRP